MQLTDVFWWFALLVVHVQNRTYQLCGRWAIICMLLFIYNYLLLLYVILNLIALVNKYLLIYVQILII